MGLTSEEPDGRLVRELVPARRLDDGLVEITGSPALVMGCVAEDVLRVDEGGRFEVLRRGPNVSVQAFSDPAFSGGEVQRLTDGLRSLAASSRPHRIAASSWPRSLLGGLSDAAPAAAEVVRFHRCADAGQEDEAVFLPVGPVGPGV